MNKSSLHKHIPIVVLIVVLVTSCNNQKKIISELGSVLQNKSSKLGIDFNKKEVLVIIPRTGCSDCIGTADLYYKEASYDPSRIQFVFTRIQSVKTLKIRMGKDIVRKEFVHIDSESRFSTGKLHSIYPLIVRLEEGEIKGIEYLSPDKKNLIDELRDRVSL
ncbi:hypothetical protein [Roseivirga misakiensis]|uniref:Lipoprotein n=1 Tax=Roseivirga misakiensis TaxID=1563681 RepID=A0A1E5T5Q6_9BACT|nr:hypothetical protein [Roseivirga misakiensis]OEK06686.1 hypothetical protein BFP71_03205 [Roseivirga misakiensis]